MPHRISSPLLRSALLCASAVPLALLAGCAMTPSEPADTTISQISGVVHGGETPIQAATVSLYATSSSATGYGQVATLIGIGTTSASGAFTISPSATSSNCPSGQLAYLTSAGGYQSGQPTLANNSVLLMAVLGNCSSVSSSTYAVINEITTVAAGYALSGFMTTSANGSLYQANVSAPAANSAATGSITAAAGLKHSWLNAANLANSNTGVANSQTSVILIGGGTAVGNVPLVEINTIAGALQACVNGATGNSACGSLFAATPSISGATPTNTLQSVIYLARNPGSAAAMNATSGLFSLVPTTPAFQPVLTASPPDWSLAIVYSGSAFLTPYDIALDANDTVYAGGSAVANLVALSPYGVITPAYTAGSSGSNTRQLAPDSQGNVWLTNNGAALFQYSASGGGAPTNTYTFTGGDVFGVAVDKTNNVWVANAVATSPNITELAYTAGTPATYAASYTATAANGFEPVEMTIDAAQNVWVSAYYTGGTYADVLANLTPASTPSYSSMGTPVSAMFAGSATKPLGVVIDASGNAWYGITGSNSVTTTGIEEVIPTLTSSVITSLTPQSLVANATLGAKASQIPGIDGAGSIYLPDNQGGGTLGVHVYSTVTVSGNTSQVLSPPSGYLGCFLATATTTTCGTGSASAVYNPRVIAIDSTGSVWAGITTGGFTQLIGLASPAWPLLQTGKPSVSPGNSSAMSLP